MGNGDGKAILEDSCAESRQRLANVENRSDDEIDSCGCLSKGFEGGEDDDVEESADDTCGEDEKRNIDVQLLNDEIKLLDSC